MKNAPENEKLELAVLHFAERLILVFSSPFFRVEFRKNLHSLSVPGLKSIREGHILPTIQNACLITTLMSLRDIDDFLTPRTKDSRKDDLKASDFEFHNSSSFLTASERSDINKLIIHSTSHAAYADENIGWDIGELTMKGVSQGLQFLNWVKTNYSPPQHSRAWAAAHFYIMQIELIIKYMKKISASHTTRTESSQAS